MKKTACLAALLLMLPTVSYAADDMLAAAMKRIAELEAANKAQANEISRLKSKPSAQVVRTEPRASEKKISASKPAPSLISVAPSTSMDKSSSLTGFYAGVNGGYGGGDVAVIGDDFALRNANGSPQLTNYTRNNYTRRFGGALAGGQVGYNYFVSNRFLIGGEVDVDWADISTKNNGSFGMFSDSNGVSGRDGDRYGLRWLGTARARLGYKIGPIVPYITGGLAFGQASAYNSAYLGQLSSFFIGNQAVSSYGNKFSAGWAAGAGLEYSVTDDLSIKTEYLYTQISGVSINGSSFYYSAIPAGITLANFPPTVSTSIINGNNNPYGFHQVRFGVNYHLHLDDAPSVVAAKY